MRIAINQADWLEQTRLAAISVLLVANLLVSFYLGRSVMAAEYNRACAALASATDINTRRASGTPCIINMANATAEVPESFVEKLGKSFGWAGELEAHKTANEQLRAKVNELQLLLADKDAKYLEVADQLNRIASGKLMKVTLNDVGKSLQIHDEYLGIVALDFDSLHVRNRLNGDLLRVGESFPLMNDCTVIVKNFKATHPYEAQLVIECPVEGAYVEQVSHETITQ